MDEAGTRRLPVLTRARAAVKCCAYSGFARGRWQQPDRVLDALGLTPGMRVADVGAGAGYFTFRLAHAVGPGGRVYAVEPDADVAALIGERAARRGLDHVETVVLDDPALPEPVDVALIVNAFHHLPDPGAYVTRLRKALEPGGRVAIIEPLPRWFLFGHATDPDRIRTVTTAAGFVVAEAHDFLPRQSFLVFEPVR